MKKRGKSNINRLGQVWIETVIYTLIALVMIGAVLAFVKPKIEEMQDKAIIEQSMGVIEGIDGEILSVVKGGQGNKRIIPVVIKKGSLIINGEEDSISFYIEGKYAFSEPGIDVDIAGITARTEKAGKISKITLTKSYKDRYDIKFNLKDEIKRLEKSPTPYKISIINSGANNEGIQIDISIS